MLQTPVKPLNVWLVDDDASIRWVLERALRQGGMAPTAFDHADTALAALRRDRPDVLITDIRMPGRSGLELLTEIRDNQPDLPVIVMTAHSDLDSAVAAYQGDRKSTRLNSSHVKISYAVVCLKKINDEARVRRP